MIRCTGSIDSTFPISSVLAHAHSDGEAFYLRWQFRKLNFSFAYKSACYLNSKILVGIPKGLNSKGPRIHRLELHGMKWNLSLTDFGLKAHK